MMWTELKNAIAQYIKTNGNNEITGNILQNVLNSLMVDGLGASQIKGVATTGTNPGTPDGVAIWFLGETGTYSNFSGITKSAAEIAYAEWNGSSWVKHSIVTNTSIGGGGEVNTASNTQTPNGIGIFKTKVNADLIFKSLKAGDNITLSETDNYILIKATNKMLIADKEPQNVLPPDEGKYILGAHNNQLWLKAHDGTVKLVDMHPEPEDVNGGTF